MMSRALILKGLRLALVACATLQITSMPIASAKKGGGQVLDFTSDADNNSSSGGLPESARTIAPRKKRVWFFDSLPAKDKSKTTAKDTGKDGSKKGATPAPATPAAPAKKTEVAAKKPVKNSPTPASVGADNEQASSSSRRALNSVELRDQAQGAVFSLETRIDKHAAKASYGTAFVVRTDGHLMTNYHVVSQAILNPDLYQLYLKVDNAELPANVVSFDILNDLAVIKVARNFKRALSFDARIPARGERVYSIGLPQDTSMTLVEGTFSDEQTAGYTNYLVLSAPLNPGMSGGPTLDGSGTVIGVNDGMMAAAQNMAFVVPAKDAQKFLIDSHNYLSGGKTVFRSETEGRKEIQRQIASFDGGWRKSWQQTRPLEVAEWRVKGVPSYLRCWQDRRQENKQLDVELGHCKSLSSISIGDNSEAGTVDIEVASINELAYNKVLYNLNNLRDKNFGPALKQFKKGGSDSDQLGKYICHHENVQLSGLPFLAEVCMTRTNAAYPLFDTMVLLTWLDEHPQKFLARMSLSGFTRDQSMFAVRQFMESVERKEQP